jgi:predicted nucleotidyltransferase
MTANLYTQMVSDVITAFDPKGECRYFLFGSSVREKRFKDIDVGVVGAGGDTNLSALRDRFYDSAIPYKVDIVDFDRADEDFKEYVFKNEPIVWIN